MHYHIREPQLNENDVRALKRFAGEVRTYGINQVLGLVASQEDPRKMLMFLSHGKEKFKVQLLAEYHKNEFVIIGKLFDAETVGDVDISGPANIHN